MNFSVREGEREGNAREWMSSRRRRKEHEVVSYHAPIYHVLVHADPLSNSRLGKDYEAESPGAAGVAVPHDDGLGDLPEAAKVVAEAVLVRLPGDAADEELAGVGLHLVRASSPPLLPLQSTSQVQFIPASHSKCGQNPDLSTRQRATARARAGGHELR
jgi:hypothetical protein